MGNLRNVLVVRKTDYMRNEETRKICYVEKGVLERINEIMLRWLGHVERMDNYWLVKQMF